MHPNFRRFLLPNKIQKELLCYSDGMGFESNPDFRIERESYNNYLIMYTIHGLLWCHQNNHKIAVYPGEYIFLDLRKPHKYYFQEGIDTKIAWITINGSPAIQLVQYLQQTSVLPYKTKDETIYPYMQSFFELSDCPNPDIFAQSEMCYALLMKILKANTHEPSQLSGTERQRAFQEIIWQIISHNLHRNVSVEELAAAVSMSKYHFIRTFHNIFGTSPMKFITREKIRQAQYQLIHTTMTITDISESLGFTNPSYFAKVFKENLGQTPSEYRFLPSALKNVNSGREGRLHGMDGHGGKGR